MKKSKPDATQARTDAAFSYTIFNIETIGDPKLQKELKPNEDSIEAPSTWKDPEKIAAYKSEKLAGLGSALSLEPLTCRIICFSHKHPNQGVQTLIGDEKAIVDRFCTVFTGISNTCPAVGFNSSQFDLPVMFIAALRHLVKFPIDWRSMTKYGATSLYVDVRSVLTGFDSKKRGKLWEWSTRLGGPEIFGSGSQVAEWWKAKDGASIMRHCESNVLATEFLYRRLVDAGTQG